MRNPAVTPMPPVATDIGLPWDVPVQDPIAALAEVRRTLGDTFIVASGGDLYLFTFSPRGVRSFYALPGDRASKGAADWRMLRRKLPDEIFVGRRVLPSQLFGRDDVAAYLANVQRALDDTVLELGDAGEIDVFELMRRLGHRVGLGSWGGPGSASGERFDRLVGAFDALDGADSFVHPDAMAAVASSGKSAEYQALDVVIAELSDALSELPGLELEHPLFARVAATWADEPDTERMIGVAEDIALVHIASMSNLFAALGWGLIDLLGHPEEAAVVRSGDRNLAEACALESIRLAQRSIMARYVLQPVTMDVGNAIYEVGAGVTVATLLPLTNTSAAPGFDTWDLNHYELEPGWVQYPSPVPAQIGGVARSSGPCPLHYRRRENQSVA
jgi:cytochrome P450